jgi:hypothetical protein
MVAKKKLPRIGFILYEGPSELGGGDIICIVTLKSSNRKTGNMAQVWILPKGVTPDKAVRKVMNFSACGTCALQGKWDKDKKQVVNRVCYVNLGQAPRSIYRSYKRGRYPVYDRQRDEVFLSKRDIRLGAYGDPAALPLNLVTYLATVGTGWTGYSHQLFWIDRSRADVLAKYVMVSCHTPAQHAESMRRGWRSFLVVPNGKMAPSNAVECPNYTHGVSCQKCQLCQGTSKRAKDIYVIAHAKVGSNLPKVQSLQGTTL